MSLYNAPFGSEDHPYCAWLGNSGVSDEPFLYDCKVCGDTVGDEDCKLVKGEIVCNECIKWYGMDEIEKIIDWSNQRTFSDK